MQITERTGLIALVVTTLVAFLSLVLAKATVVTTMSDTTLLVPLALPLSVVWGLVVARVWDRLLRGKNVPEVKVVPSGNDPYRPRFGRVTSTVTALALALGLTTASGCATGYRATYGAGAITKELVTQSHDDYSSEFNARWTQCDPRLNPESEVRTIDDMNDCLGEGYDQESVNKVLTALAAYRLAAATLSAVLLQADPSKEDLDKAWKDAFNAAVELFEALPEGSKNLAKLRALLGRLAPA